MWLQAFQRLSSQSEDGGETMEEWLGPSPLAELEMGWKLIECIGTAALLSVIVADCLRMKETDDLDEKKLQPGCQADRLAQCLK
jgi:hypothetical protein